MSVSVSGTCDSTPVSSRKVFHATREEEGKAKETLRCFNAGEPVREEDEEAAAGKGALNEKVEVEGTVTSLRSTRVVVAVVIVDDDVVSFFFGSVAKL